jgi:hypothetical protein
MFALAMAISPTGAMSGIPQGAQRVAENKRRIIAVAGTSFRASRKTLVYVSVFWAFA